MKLKELVKSLNLKVLVGMDLLDRDVTGGYASDMLSDVLANSDKGYVWVTMQIHPNVPAVASTKDLSGIIIVNGRKPEAQTLTKAEEKKVPILLSQRSTYQVVGRLYELGIR
ncbi:MAG TPA: DRTGG domain-containing protein [Syntrophorhabdales bacterium]|nr:DRTGG domain-containing protein [Syntrophorhabdales bacterium]